jgi:hypothetical protein
VISQYLYISTAPDLSREDVAAILESSTRNNPQADITGLLLYNGRNFIQLIEGEEASLAALMKRISADPRHNGVSMLDCAQASERACPGWAMKRIAIAQNVDERRAELDRQLPPGLNPEHRKILMNFAVLN